MTEQREKRAPRNRTITLAEADCELYRSRLQRLSGPTTLEEVLDHTICQDLFEILDFLPPCSVDLIFADPPYNLSKSFNRYSFAQVPLLEYEQWLESWLGRLARVVKPTGSVYVCADWRSSTAVQSVLERLFTVRSRITWEREKGRGSRNNWKNCAEDIWFCTASDDYVFNVEDVKLKRRVIAPYTSLEGKPKDWHESSEGRFRLTYPSNIWTDVTVPFWSMRENTDHPTQKAEKLLARIVLASSREGDIVLDPFLGSGTTSVVAKKLKRHYIGIEIDELFCCLAEHRLSMAELDPGIQGYAGGVFWERNTLSDQRRHKPPTRQPETVQPTLLSGIPNGTRSSR